MFGDAAPIEYAAYALAGLAVWGFLRDAATAGSRALLTNEAYLRQSPLPYTVYTLRTVLGQAFHSGLALSVVVALLVIRKGDPAALVGVGLALPALVLVVIAAWAVATIGAFVTAFFHDTAHLLEVGAQLGFFLTPIMYRRTILDDRGLGWVVDVNPVNAFLAVIRDPLLMGVPSADGLARLGQAYASAAVLTAVLVALAVGVVSWLHKKVIFHL
jgi:ABC-type polysaccharide/polyol phosphate export permease